MVAKNWRFLKWDLWSGFHKTILCLMLDSSLLLQKPRAWKIIIAIYVQLSGHGEW